MTTYEVFQSILGFVVISAGVGVLLRYILRSFKF